MTVQMVVTGIPNESAKSRVEFLLQPGDDGSTQVNTCAAMLRRAIGDGVAVSDVTMRSVDGHVGPQILNMRDVALPPAMVETALLSVDVALVPQDVAHPPRNALEDRQRGDAAIAAIASSQGVVQQPQSHAHNVVHRVQQLNPGRGGAGLGR